jgi:hypothetical protein
VSTLSELIDNLVADEWRADNPFSPEVASCHGQLLAAQTTDQCAAILSNWLVEHQPCFFGRFAAKRGLIDYCFLSESDWLGGDRHVAGTIAQHRLAWRKRARRGESHAFVIVAISDVLARAKPNKALLEVAKRIAELYLCRDVPPDKVVHDELFLEAKECRSWKVGVNYFASQGDGRWWKDHRIPGGIALSMNSVGHMACVRRLGKNMGDDDQSQGLHWALRTAMQLLDETQPGVSGRNTWLHEIQARSEPAHITCPDDLGLSLAGKNRCEYGGLYHTDHTLPGTYFTPESIRPEGPKFEDLNLTYLHDDSPDNSDYGLMGTGIPQN